jgi:hypothetical protein
MDENEISSTKIDESGNDFIDNLYHDGLLMFGKLINYFFKKII